MSGTGQLGWCYLYGRGIEKCLVRATAFLTEGALGGSKSSCYNLGIRYANGSNGFPKDLKMARRYYSMVATASVDDMSPDTIAKAAAWVREHPA